MDPPPLPTMSPPRDDIADSVNTYPTSEPETETKYSIRIAKTKQRHRAASLVFFEKNKADEVKRRNTYTINESVLKSESSK